MDDEAPDEEASSEEFGAALPPTDVDTTGSSGGASVQGAPPDANWRENTYFQAGGGFVGGLGLGVVPFASMGRQALEDARVMHPGTR
ncbi:MAG: hypothetical protein HUU21_31010, partial [Polyangiaceae bacterium]|nr:hypothetical protein [Polyangiaceae bacterium]